ncbi:hypothetical protein J3F83DRAFT_712622 [Trichoderma novae-zelandiae]
MSGENGKKEPPAVTSYVNDFEGDLSCRLVTIVHEEMKKLDTQVVDGETAGAEADESPVSDEGRTWD